MHYVNCRYHPTKKHKFGISSPDVFFVESITIPPEEEKYCVYVSRHEWTVMHYVTRRFQRM
jgi:hypothetical protein